MLIAGLNYNSNLGLAFAFLMASLALVAMHHCHRNLLGLSVDVNRRGRCLRRARTPPSNSRCATRPRWIGATSRSVWPPMPQAVAQRRRERRRTRHGHARRRPARRDGASTNSSCARAIRSVGFAPGPMCRDRCRRSSRRGRAATAAAAGCRHGGSRAALRGARRRGFRRPAGLRPRRAAEAHGVEGAGARRRCRRCAATPVWRRSPNGSSGPRSRASTPRRACRSCAAGCWPARPDTGAPTDCRMPGIEISPGRGAAHRARCLRALALHPASRRSSEPGHEARGRLGHAGHVRAAASRCAPASRWRWLAHLSALPVWLIGIVCAAAAIRLGLAARGRTAPPRAHSAGRRRRVDRAAACAVPHLQRPGRRNRAARP